MHHPEPIAIIGTGCRFPGDANSPAALWDLLRSPRDLLTSIPNDRFPTTGFYHESGQYHGHSNVRYSYLLDGGKYATHRQFDAQFFGMTPAEASVTDPQLRLLLETVFEALEDAGQAVDRLRGSDTAVYTGLMCNDYEHIMRRDEEFLGTYHALGTSRAMLSNRVSYAFDLRGPSMTIDTACSSSLYAVHYAVQQLRSGASRVAIAAGTNLLLDNYYYVAESKLNMLSPSGRSRMWDSKADGYGRGEGVAAVVLKLLSAAEADGDHIECIIRETGVNQDGKTVGITMPSSDAQANLIRDCYRRAGLDLSTPAGRPQYFEAHGTGTPAGDPIEAKAVASSIFGESSQHNVQPLFVGSIKTVVGHTEGAAGLAGMLKASLALQNSIIPPNMLFERLSSRVEPFYTNLRIPETALTWPHVLPGQPRRASVNSFGFGGANAHAILESYMPPTEGLGALQAQFEGSLTLPFIFSAACERSLRNNLRACQIFLQTRGKNVDIGSFSHTLNTHRSRLPLVTRVSAVSIEELATKIGLVHDASNFDHFEYLGDRANAPSRNSPRILAVFTGQGAQWPKMGAELILYSPVAAQTLEKLQHRLDSLPIADRPSWSLKEELLQDAAASRLGTAIVAQPLCTAVQIILIDILRSASVNITAVVGHSSGEIGAAYAAGAISAEEAICIAYYRGLYSHLAQGPHGQEGAMLAVGTTSEDAQDLLGEPEFQGRAVIAAINSTTSVTLSGDAESIDHLAIVFKDEKKFARRLKVDKAYHSHHMLSCSTQYYRALEALNIQPQASTRCSWFSSVFKDNSVETQSLSAPYWDWNMAMPVQFMQAISNACETSGPFDIALEVGPHPTLKGPAMETLHLFKQSTPYMGLLHRSLSALETLSDCVGFISGSFGSKSVDFGSFYSSLYGNSSLRILKDLPTYQWNHDKEYWHESRFARAIRGRSSVHELLGHLTPDSSEQDMRWRHLLRPGEISWMTGHRLQGQIVLPAAAYIVSAFEASLVLLGSKLARMIEVLDFQIRHALTFEEDSSVEIVFRLTNLKRFETHITADFGYDAAIANDQDSLSQIASGSIRIELEEPSPSALPRRTDRARNLFRVDTKEFYDYLESHEYQYSGHFSALSGLERKLGAVTGFIQNVADSNLLIHPALLDVAFQSLFLAASTPGDGELWSLHVPTRVKRIRINPMLFNLELSKGSLLPFDTVQSNIPSFSGDIDVFPPQLEHAMLQVEGLECVPFSPATASDDKTLFSTTVWKPAIPEAPPMVCKDHDLASIDRQDLSLQLERVAVFYLRQLAITVPKDHPSRFQGPYRSILSFAAQSSGTNGGDHGLLFDPAWENDDLDSISRMTGIKSELVDFKLLHKVGQTLLGMIVGTSIELEADKATIEDLLHEFFYNGLGMQQWRSVFQHYVEQVTHRTPHINCLELSDGSGASLAMGGGATGHLFSSYTFASASARSLSEVKSAFESHASQTASKTHELDIEQPPAQQGFQKAGYELIVGHLTHNISDVEAALRNIRYLVKPGGYLVVAALPDRLPARMALSLGALPALSAVHDGRNSQPLCLEIPQWDDLLKRTGFSGCDTVFSEHDTSINAFRIISTQAVTEQISFLREPFRSGPEMVKSTSLIQDLIFIGGSSPKITGLATALDDLLRPLCSGIKHCQHFEDLEEGLISPTSTVLVLADLDCPVFSGLNKPAWEGLKLLFHEAGAVVWLTTGRSCAQPYANMTVGLLRSAVHEIPGLSLQFIDLEDELLLSAKGIAEALLRFKAVTRWRSDGSDDVSMMPIEPELAMKKGGAIFVPRLIPDPGMNDRYNSSRRPITRIADLSQSGVRLVNESGGYHLRPRHFTPDPSDSCSPEFHVTHSLLVPMRFSGRVQFYISLGRRENSSMQCLALSTTQASVLHPDVVIPVGYEINAGSEADFLHVVGIHNVVSEVLQNLDEGDRILTYEPGLLLGGILQSRAQDCGVDVLLTTSGEGCSGELHINPHAPDRSLVELDLPTICVLLDLSDTARSEAFAQRVRNRLSNFCRHETDKTLFGGSVGSSSAKRTDRARELLLDAVKQASQHISTLDFHDMPTPTQVIKIGDDMSELDPFRTPFLVIDWDKSNKVVTRVRPVDTDLRLSANKTYWLAGLTGSLGVSLCQWMVDHGARYVVLSSRQPQVDPLWVKQMQRVNAVIKVMACDLGDEQATRTLYRDISATMPPIAGVVNGAMVLRDTRLSNMSFETLQEVLRPKVQGSISLNQLFQNDSLEFFVLFSSVSSVVGVPGQAAYNAANSFMASLVEQRRQQGLVASVINIGAIIGTGYISENSISTSVMRDRMALNLISEHDFHQAFAEALQSGRPGFTNHAQITAGISPVKLDGVNEPIWASNPLMSHFVISPESAKQDTAGPKSKVQIQARLLAASSQQEIHTVIRDALIDKLDGIFHLPQTANKAALDSQRLDELGIDSLIAVDIRGWLMQHLRVNYPVLKLLSGISIGELVYAVVEDLNANLLANIQPSSAPNSSALSAGTEESLEQIDPHSANSAGAKCTPDSTLSPSLDGSSNSGAQSESSWSSESGSPTDLSIGQKMFWFVREMMGDKTSLNHTISFRLRGPLRLTDLEAAVRNLGQQHEALRTRFLISKDMVLQSIMESSVLALEHRWITKESEVSDVETEVQQHVYDLEKGETGRLIVLSLSAEVHTLILGGTTLSTDGLCSQILLKDLLHHYNHHPTIQPTPQFRQFSEAQNHDLQSGGFQDDISFWKGQYHDFPPPLPILRVSSASSRPRLSSLDEVRVTRKVDITTKGRIRDLCRGLRVTPFHFYLACFRVLLSRFSDLEDVSIGIGDMNRPTEHWMRTVGVFVNMLPLRFRNTASTKFNALLQGTRETVYTALHHSRVPFQVLLDELAPSRSAAQTPIFQCFVDYRVGQRERESWGACSLELLSFQGAKTGYDLNLDIIDDPDGECRLILNVRGDIYTRSEAETLCTAYEMVVRAFATDPEVFSTEPSIYPQNQVSAALGFSQGPLCESQWPETVIHRIDQIVQTRAAETAIQDHSGGTVTYVALMRLSYSIASQLSASGATMGTMVAVLQEPTAHWVASLLAILRIGAIYVPLDLSTPWSRLSAIVRDCCVTQVLVDSDTRTFTSKLGKSDLVVTDVSLVAVDDSVPDIKASSDGNAMILCTSGSTGKPKGIILKHEGIRNQLEAYQRIYGLGLEVVLQQSAFSFDHSYAQVFTALCHGGTLQLLPRRLRGDARAITDLMSSRLVSHTIATPTEYFSWIHYGDVESLRESQWRVAHCAGESVPHTLVSQFKDLDKPGLRLFNAYGPTEISVNATCMELIYSASDQESLLRGNIPAGSVLPNYSIYVLDDQLVPVPPGVQGEIYIGGAGVATGYVNDPASSSAAFVSDVFACDVFKNRGWTKMHRSGDLGRWREDGNLLIEGRIAGDTQVKIRGIRVDLREIEHHIVMKAAGAVIETIVSIRQSTCDTSGVLVAHTVLDPSLKGKDTASILEVLRSSLELPQYMRPAFLLAVPNIPRTTSGKVDRKALSALPLPYGALISHQASGTEELTQTEARLRDLWVEALPQQDQVHLHLFTPETEFFDVGGTSLLLLALQAMIKRHFHTRIRVVQMLEASTLRAMASVIEKGQPPDSATIDWQRETALSQSMLQCLSEAKDVDSGPELVVLTGVTGRLGRAILDNLIADPAVKTIFCIAIRNLQTQTSLMGLPKVRLFHGNLRLSRLGLSEQDAHSIFAKASRIVHNGAEVSHMRYYHSLRLPNLQSTKELISMCGKRKIPFHYVSTTNVGVYLNAQPESHHGTGEAAADFAEVSLAAYPPPTDGFGGYPASKWASEVFLERLSDETSGGWPVFVHRPSLISRVAVGNEQGTAETADTGLDVIHTIRKFAARMKAVPISPSSLQGYIDTVTLTEVATGVVASLHEYEGVAKNINIRHYCGDERLSLQDLKSWIMLDTDEGEAKLEELPLKEWAHRASRAGMDLTLVTMIESVASARQLIFPRVTKASQTA